MATVLPGEFEVRPDAMEPKAIMGVYGAFDRDSGEALYVGLSENIRTRIMQHRQQLARDSKSKKLWDDCFKVDVDRVTWMLLETVVDRKLLNRREHEWWRKLNPRFNQAAVRSKNYRTGGDTRRRRPENSELRALRASGRTAREIADLFGVTVPSVYGWFRNMGEPFDDLARRRTQNGARQRAEQFIQDPANLTTLEERVRNGASINAVCSELKLDRGIVTNALAERECYSKQSHTELELRKARTDKVVNEPAVLASLAARIMAGEELQAIARSEGLQLQRLRKSLAPHFAQLAKPKTTTRTKSSPKRKKPKPKTDTRAGKLRAPSKRENARSILLDESKLAAIEERVKSGEFLAYICRELDADWSIIRAALAERGCYSKRSREGNKRQRTREALASDKSRREIVDLVLAGSSLAQICRDFELEWSELSEGLEAIGVHSAHRKSN